LDLLVSARKVGKTATAACDDITDLSHKFAMDFNGYFSSSIEQAKQKALLYRRAFYLPEVKELTVDRRSS
jgi:hypothetical protein